MNPRMPECEHRVPFDSECRECSKRSLRNKLDDNRRLVTLLRKQLDTSVDKQLLLLNQVIDLKAENERLIKQREELIKVIENGLAHAPHPTLADPAEAWRAEGFDKWRETRHARIGD